MKFIEHHPQNSAQLCETKPQNSKKHYNRLSKEGGKEHFLNNLTMVKKKREQEKERKQVAYGSKKENEPHVEFLSLMLVA